MIQTLQKVKTIFPRGEDELTIGTRWRAYSPPNSNVTWFERTNQISFMVATAVREDWSLNYLCRSLCREHATNWVERKNRTKACWSLAWRPTYWLKRRFTIVLTRGKGERKVNRFVDLPLPVRLRQREGAGPKNEQEPQLPPPPSSWLRVRFRDRALSALRKKVGWLWFETYSIF